MMTEMSLGCSAPRRGEGEREEEEVERDGWMKMLLLVDDVAGVFLLAVVDDVVVCVVVVCAHVCIDVCSWFCVSIATTSACEVPPAVTGVNTRGLRDVVDRVLDDPSAIVMGASICDWGGSYRMFEGEDGDAAAESSGASRCSPSSTLIAAAIGKLDDGDNIDGNSEEARE
jgi:hypothetical protein